MKIDMARRVLPGHFLRLVTLSNASGADALMRLLFQGGNDLVETLDISRLDSMGNSAFQGR